MINVNKESRLCLTLRIRLRPSNTIVYNHLIESHRKRSADSRSSIMAFYVLRKNTKAGNAVAGYKPFTICLETPFRKLNS